MKSSFLLLLCLMLAVQDVVAVQVKKIPAITQRVNWTRLEALEDLELWCGGELKNGNLLFAAPGGLVEYDGYRSREIPFPDAFLGAESYAIRVTDEETVYMVTSHGLLFYSFTEGWSRMLEFSMSLTGYKFLFAENSEGFLVVAVPGGIYSLNGKRAVLEAELKEPVSSLAVSGRNDLFLAKSEGNRVIRIPFTREALRHPEYWREQRASKVEAHDNNLFTHGPEGDVYSADFYKNSKARRFSYKTESWEDLDVPSSGGGNYHSLGLSIDDETLIIATKTALHVLNRGDWHSISSNEDAIPTNAVYCFLRKNGNLVIGGHSESVWEVDLSENRWMGYTNIHFHCNDIQGNAWFIRKDGAVIEEDFSSGEWITHLRNVISSPTSVICSDDGMIWVSGAHEGVAAVSHYDGVNWVLDVHPELVSSVSHLSAKQLSNGDVAFGSGHEFAADVGGLIVYSKRDGKYTFRHVSSPQVSNRIVGIAEPVPGQLWFGGYTLTFNELPLVQPQREFPIREIDWVDHICGTPDEVLLVGSWQKGLGTIIDGQLDWISSTDRLASGNIVYVLADNWRESNLWVATRLGVSRFNGENWIPDALPGDLGMTREGGTLAQDSLGRIWLNFASRDWYFRTSLLDYNAGLDQSVFKTIRFEPDQEPPIVKITRADDGTMEPANVVVAWEGIDKWSRTPRNQLRYSYRLDGEEWSPFIARENVILLNVMGGRHRIEVRARDLDANISPTVAEIEFNILFPLWRRPWFIVACLATASLIVVLITLLVRQRIKHLLQLENFKLQFFTNISHDIRTPLTVILGPLESTLRRLPEGFDKTPLELAYRNARKMLHLLDQILEFRRIEIGKVENHFVEGDIVRCIRESIDLLAPLAQDKRISISSSYSHDNYPARFDADKLERILSNLVSNAIKYTKEFGSISIRTRVDTARGTEAVLSIVVEDNGIGIEADKLKLIFEPFYRNHPMQGEGKMRGVGLGLSLVRNLVEALGGRIEVESPAVIVNDKPRGARFKLKIPVTSIRVLSEEAGEDVPETGHGYIPEVEYGVTEDKPLLMIVDDDADIREFLAKELSEAYQVRAFGDGREALEVALKLVPDLILTDIVMPRMDGNELCRRIKRDPTTCHIPVVGFTALKGEDHELRSLGRGMDDYVNKPVSIAILNQKIANFISSRDKIHEFFRQNLKQQTEGSESIAGSVDDRFLSVCSLAIEKRISDPGFDVNALAKELGVSRMTLYRKFKAVTGESPSAFIREIKMRKAAALLKERSMNVSEVADAVGFQELSNFSSSFKKHFGVSPSQFGKD